MAPNDAIVLKTNFEDWKNRADGLEEIDPWLYYCIEQYLKPYAIDDDDLESGITDGGGDGGVDGHYFIVNHRHTVTAETNIEPKVVTTIQLLFFQVKHSGGIQPTEIEKWIQTVSDFFELSKDPNSFGTRYNKKIKEAMQVWRDQYLKMSGHFPAIAVDFYYITGDDTSPDDYARDACERVKAQVQKLLKCACTVHCVGAQQLWEQVQKRPKKIRQLKWSETEMRTKDGYVGLVKLPDFRDFLEDESGGLAERIFESNVRGYLPDTPVNDAIADSLRNPGTEPNFWLMNNGITMIIAKGTPAHLMLTVDDPQIVNGLQTSRVIFDHIAAGSKDDRTVLVRVIETTDQRTQDRIIKATNSQNRMQPASLRMTDQIHRDIEELFKGDGLFYDRRKGFYKDQGKPIKKIISANAVAQAIISIMLQRPDDARARPGDYFKNDESYKSVFANNKFNLPTYLTCTKIVRRVDEFLSNSNIDKSDRKNLLFYVAALAVREIVGIKHPPAAKLPKLASLTDAALTSYLKRVQGTFARIAKKTGADSDAIARGPSVLARLNAQWNNSHGKPKKRKA